MFACLQRTGRFNIVTSLRKFPIPWLLPGLPHSLRITSVLWTTFKSEPQEVQLEGWAVLRGISPPFWRLPLPFSSTTNSDINISRTSVLVSPRLSRRGSENESTWTQGLFKVPQKAKPSFRQCRRYDSTRGKTNLLRTAVARDGTLCCWDSVHPSRDYLLYVRYPKANSQIFHSSDIWQGSRTILEAMCDSHLK